ncbi:MAG: diguanylate cyclase (GGDEF)-like protein/PAS domain S-box-containing protein, partial [Gammaproteobacteria bacterium]
MNKKIVFQDPLLENESLRKELYSLTQTNNDLLLCKQQLDAILDNAPIEVYLKDREGRYIVVNKQFEKLFGVKNKDLIGLLPTDVHYTDLAVSTRIHDLSVLNSGEVVQREETVELFGENKTRALLTIKFPVFDSDGKVDGLGAIVTDVTEKVKAEGELLQSNILFNKAEKIGKLGHWEWDQVTGRHISFSEQYANLFSMTAKQMFEHSGKEGDIHLVCDEDRERYIQVIDAACESKQGWDIEYRHIDKAGKWVYMHELGEPVLDDHGTIIKTIGTIQDITERKLAEAKLVHLAHYDLLTDLPNRVLLADRLSLAMLQCQRRHQSLAVAYLDLDGFKTVNDTHGHDVGDELLVALSRRMKEALREGDTLARIGGDEFVAVMVDLEKIEDSEPVLERLLKAAANPVALGDAVMQVSASIGVTLYPQDDADADQLMRHADQAMYAAKQAGKNRYHLFDTALDDAINIQRESISDICSALKRREFVLHYQ